MALVDQAWYVNYGNGSSTGYYAVIQWATGTVIAAGALRRQLAAPAVGSERVFVCIVAGTTHATTEPTWVITRGGKTTDNTVTWQECTGIAALNGDATNTPSWTITATPPGGVKNTAVTLGQVIKRDNGASYQICTTAGTAGNGAEPAFSNTAGTTTADNTVTWTSLGVVGNFTGWQAPHAREENACTATWGQAGNAFFIATESLSTSAANRTVTSPGSQANPSFFYSVTKTTLPPVSANLSSGASITTTGNSNLSIGGNADFYATAFNCGTTAQNTVLTIGSGSANAHLFEACSFSIPATGSTANMVFGSSSAEKVRLVSCTFTFGAVGQTMRNANGARVEIIGGSIAATGSVPTTLFDVTNGTGGEVLLDGVDLSAFTSGKTIVGANANRMDRFKVTRCKLGASVTLAATPNTRGAIYDFIQCDSGATNYLNARYTYEGTQTVDTTIVRTGGATDGTTLISEKIVTTANSKWIFPFESQPITIWNDSTSAITSLTIYGTTTGGGVPKDDEIWVEVEYLGASGSPLGSIITTTKANSLAASAATNNSADGSTWAGGGAGNGFKIVVPSFTPGQKGPINITIKAAKASTTYYIDPKPSISGITVSKSYVVAPGIYVNERASAAVANVGLHPIDMGIAA
ncbi:hypothetical protein [Mesorhizobium sp. B263B2A]|uniref:hypothetical protein n=1 Tax=Mesorhizobium sp. B263B2A TaxID=2876669 RepID=UPI001CD067E0|nr:hypothetical protein [Mesorhizobium sp. B263B2A]MCA0032756.1 hypothetical protein [Mesorhizobium sp. B263B2A]